MNITQRNQDEAVNCAGHQSWHRVVINDFGNDNVEISVTPYETWSEPDLEEKPKVARGEGDRVRSAERAAKGARKEVRHKCKVHGVRYMVTLTTKAIITDPKQFQRLFQEFVRRIRTVTGFEYIAVPEYQQRGALHLHIAVARRQDYKLLWSVWHRVVGVDNGRVHVTKGIKSQDTRRISSYLSKYLTKSFAEGALNRKRYWTSKGIPKPTKEVQLLRGDWSIVEAIKYVAEFLIERRIEWSFRDAWLDHRNGIFWIAAASS